jgi:hypothetical protein
MNSVREATAVHVLPQPSGNWLVRVGDDADGTEHPTAGVAEREARRRACALGIDVVLLRDRYQRVHQTRALAGAR